MKNKEKKFTWADDGPFPSQQDEKDNKNECFYLVNNESLKYCCKNFVYKFDAFSQIHFTNNNKMPNSKILLINQLQNFDIGLCENHINFLNKEYNINLIEDFLDLLKDDIGENNDWSLNLIKELKSNQELKRVYKEDQLNLEVSWIFYDIYCATYPTLPFWLLSNYSFHKYNGKNSKNQGFLNGPDFIFSNKNKKYLHTIGFEIVTLDQNIFKSFNSDEEFKKHSLKTIYSRLKYNSYESYLFDKASLLVDKKIKASKNYEFTNDLFLGIILNNVAPNYAYYLLRILLKRKYKNSIFKDFIFF